MHQAQDSARDQARADREALADAFAARLAPFQDAAIDEARRGRWPLRLQMDAQEWLKAGRPAWRESYAPAPTCATLAQLEAIARKYHDPKLETVAIESPRA